MSDGKDIRQSLQECGGSVDAATWATICAAIKALDELREKNAELEHLFDLQEKADRRAVTRWQEATGRKSVWPDRADLVVWLMQYVELGDAINTQISADLRAAQSDGIQKDFTAP